MAFQFMIKNSAHLSVADLWLLEGVLLSGEITNNTSAIAQTDVGQVSVSIKTVAFIETEVINSRVLTLNIERPVCDIKLLEGKMLVAKKEATQQEKEIAA